jgi:hypothetical protein
MLNETHIKIFKTWTQVTCIHTYSDYLYIQKHTNVDVKSMHLIYVCPCVDSDCVMLNEGIMGQVTLQGP